MFKLCYCLCVIASAYLNPLTGMQCEAVIHLIQFADIFHIHNVALMAARESALGQHLHHICQFRIEFDHFPGRVQYHDTLTAFYVQDVCTVDSHQFSLVTDGEKVLKTGLLDAAMLQGQNDLL